MTSLFRNPDTAIPAWLVSVAFFAAVVEFLARGRTGQFVLELFKGRQSRANLLVSILREKIEEQSREADEIKALVREVGDRLEGLLDEAEKARAAALSDVLDRLKELVARTGATREMVSTLNATLARHIEASQEARSSELATKLDSLVAHLTGSDKSGS